MPATAEIDKPPFLTNETRSTAIAVQPRSHADNVKEWRGPKRRLEAEQQEKVKNKFALLLKVSLPSFTSYHCKRAIPVLYVVV
jgi:hypothetical protein